MARDSLRILARILSIPQGTTRTTRVARYIGARPSDRTGIWLAVNSKPTGKQSTFRTVARGGLRNALKCNPRTLPGYGTGLRY